MGRCRNACLRHRLIVLPSRLLAFVGVCCGGAAGKGVCDANKGLHQRPVSGIRAISFTP
jgi:hypothetical protein